MLYIACPYSHPDAAVRNHRYRIACRAAAILIKSGIVVFSPLSHSVPVAQLGGVDETDTEFWLRQDIPILHRCGEVLVLGLSGWDKSIGVQREISEAMSLQKPVSIITEQEIDALPNIAAEAMMFGTSTLFKNNNARR
ncbi:hypothetical protein FACS189427_09380 [Planctomycetales bacterium]|nr:hypothetical protein FACS189427_09380 [Planctomycetales bacterium]